MMYPILYSRNEEPSLVGDSYDLGLGVLDEAREIEVIEELNGAFTLTLLYPVTGRLYDTIERGCLLLCKSNPYSGPQLFRIQQITRPMNGVIEVYAVHKSYDLSGYVIKPCTYANVAALFSGINSKLIGQTPIPWSWWTNMTSTKEFTLSVPMSARSALAGTNQSILQTYGGEFEFDNNTIKLHNNRGINRGVTIRYGHNLIDFKQEEMFEQCYTDVLPYWQKQVYDESASTADNPVYKTVTIMPENPISTYSAIGGEGCASSTGGWNEITMPEEATWESICFGNGKFVAVAYTQNDSQLDSDTAAVSTDGIHWTTTALPMASSWVSVCYGKELFVAISSDYNHNVAAYSSDGLTWKKANLPTLTSDSWRSVCYGGGKFVAISYKGTIAAYSLNGITWHSANNFPSLTTGAGWDSVCYGNGKFVAISSGSSNTKVAYSFNGISWMDANITSGSWHSVCYGGSKFIAVGWNTNKVLRSSDGITWVESACLPRSSGWQPTCYGNGKFATLAGNRIAYSSNGTSWTESSLPSNETWMSICYGNGKFVAISEESKTISTIAPERKHILALNLSDYEFDYDSDTDSTSNSVPQVSSASAPLMANSSSYDGEISCGTVDYAYNSSYPYQGTVECIVEDKSSGTYTIEVDDVVKHSSVTSDGTYTITLDNLYDGSTSAYYTINLCDPNGNVVDSFDIYHEKKVGISLECIVTDNSLRCRVTNMDSSHAYRRRIVFQLYPGGMTYTVFTNAYATVSDYASFYDLTYNSEYEVLYSIQSESGATEYTSGSKTIKINSQDPTPTPTPQPEERSDYIPTVEELEEAAEEYIVEHKIGVPEVKMTVNFVDLSKTTEYKNLSYQTIKLGDTVNVVFDKYGINTTSKVIKTTYDPLKDSYSEIELGKSVNDFSSTIQSIATPAFTEIEDSVSETKDVLNDAIAHATEMITSAHGGEVILHVNSDSGKPSELLILSRNDNVPPTLENATHVWRWNKNGLGHSSTGYEGPYGDVAITKDGHIVADTIVFRDGYVTGTLSATNIKTSQLVVGDNVTMGSNASISWNKVTEQPTILSTSQVNGLISTYIDSTSIAAAYLKGQYIFIYGSEGITSNPYGTIYAGTNTAGTTALELYGSNGLRLTSTGNTYLASSNGGSILLGSDSSASGTGSISGTHINGLFCGSFLCMGSGYYGSSEPSSVIDTPYEGMLYFKIS